jgi:hypothetical protein
MSNHTASWTYVGLDVHADTITVAVAEGSSRGRGRGVGTIPNQPDSIRKAMKKLGFAFATRRDRPDMRCTGSCIRWTSRAR